MGYHARNLFSKPPSHSRLPRGILRSRYRSYAPSPTIRMDAREHPPQCHGNSEAKELYNSLFIGTLEKHPRFSFAVGMPVAWHPPHRSQRAILSHWAPALSHHAKTLFWIRMIDAGDREPLVHVP